MVGEPQHSIGGRVLVFRVNADATVNYTQAISNGLGGLPSGRNAAGDLFGLRVDGSVGDVDSDGYRDLLVSARDADAGGADMGALYVLYMNGDDTVRVHARISQVVGEGLNSLSPSRPRLGSSMCVLPPRSEHSVADVALGSDSDQVLVLFSLAEGTTGNINSTVHVIGDGLGGMPSGSIASGSFFGFSAGSLGDADGDGIFDLVVDAPLDDTGGTDKGALYILYMAEHNATNPVRDFTKLTATTAGLSSILQVSGEVRVGNAHADIDGDGRVDILFGMSGDATGGVGRGAMVVAFMGGAVASPTPSVTPSVTPSSSPTPSVSPSPSTTPSVSPASAADIVRVNEVGSGLAGFPSGLVDAGDSLGERLQGIGDLDGDGVPDLAAGARYDDDGNSNAGAVYVMFLRSNSTVKRVQKISALAGGLNETLEGSGEFGASVGWLH